jgi:hypothetical protein
MNTTRKNDDKKLNLAGLNLNDVEVFLQQGTRGTAEFAASSGSSATNSGINSCTERL